MEKLKPQMPSLERKYFEESMYKKIIGQDEAVQSLSDLFNLYRVGLNSPGRPIGNLLLLGPTGTGKTRLCEAMAETLYGREDAFIKIDCAEFQHSHEIAKLIGSPPGYLGHRETHPVITQESLSQYHTDKYKISLLLFDEIEKASDGLWQLLLGILDKAVLTLGDNRRVNLSNTVIFMTSNLGGREITEITEQKGIGFNLPVHGVELTGDKIKAAAEGSAKKKFTPEFMNRIDKTLVFHPLSAESLQRILDIELNKIQQRIINIDEGRIIFRVTSGARKYLLIEGTDVKYGARHLKRALDRLVVFPMANLIATGQVTPGDVIRIDFEDELVFLRESSIAV